MVTFDELIYKMFNVGVADVLLPFVLIFTLVFAIMQRTKVLGEDSKKYNLIVAMVMGLMVVFPHVLGAYPPTSDPVVLINNSLPSVSIIIVVAIMIMLLLGAFGQKLNLPEKGGLSTFLFFGAILVIGYIFAVNAGWFANGWLSSFPDWLGFLNDPDTQALIVMVLVFGVIIWFITRGEEGEKPKAPSEPWLQQLK